jgi:hypothetical protein
MDGVKVDISHPTNAANATNATVQLLLFLWECDRCPEADRYSTAVMDCNISESLIPLSPYPMGKQSL